MCDEQTPRCMEKFGKIVEHCMHLGVANMLDRSCQLLRSGNEKVQWLWVEPWTGVVVLGGMDELHLIVISFNLVVVKVHCS